MNKKVLSFVNKLEGYKTAIKELHWDSDSLSQHELCDDIAESIAEFQDTVSEVEQSITGKLATGKLKPEAYKVTTLKKFVEDVLDATNSFYKSIEDEGDTYTGMRSDCESFLSDMQRKLYLVNFTMKEDLKRSIRNKINEGFKKEENIKTTFHGTKPSTEKGLFKRINDLTKNGQLNTRVFNGVDDAFSFYNKILGNMGTLQTVEPNESIHIVKLDTNNGMSYYGLMRTKEEGAGKCKASITFSPHSEEMEQPDPQMSEPTLEDDFDYEDTPNEYGTVQDGVDYENSLTPKFKIGDRVRNIKTGKESVISEILEYVYGGIIPFYIKDQDEWELVGHDKSYELYGGIGNNNYEIYGEGRITRMTGSELHNLIKESVKKLLENDYNYNPMDLDADSVRSRYAGQIERDENYKENLKRFKVAFMTVGREYPGRKPFKDFLKYVKEVEGDSLYEKIWEHYGGEYEELADQYLQNLMLSKN